MKKIVFKTVPVLVLFTIITLTAYYTGWMDNFDNSLFLKSFIWLLAIGFSFAIILSIGILIIEKGNPTKTLAWIIIVILLPGLGVFLYSIFGAHTHGESKVRTGNKEFMQLVKSYRKNDFKAAGLDEKELEKAAHTTDRHEAIQRLLTIMSKNPKTVFTQNNRMKMLVDGKETFNELFDAIRNARHHIHMEYFIWTHDELGQEIKGILTQKVKEGVEIRVIIDGLGSLNLKNSYIRELREAGIEVAAFRPVRWAFINHRFNFRNHRKIVVVDGHTGFTGGINIDDVYLKGHPKLGYWRDTHMKIEGDAVKGLQFTFLIDWYFLMKDKVSGPAYFPKTNITNQRQVHIIASGAGAEWDGIKNAYLTAINSAKDYVWLCTPYLVPSDIMLSALKCATDAGIDVRLIVPKKGDSALVQLASQSFAEELLNYGVKVYEYQKGFVHSKVMIADDEIGTIGSANLDVRSFDQNDEVNAFIYDRQLVKEMKAQFEIDFKLSKKLDAEEYRNRPFFTHLKEGACRLFAPLL